MLNIEYIGCVWDGSGYSEFARSFIYGLIQYGHKVKVIPVSFEQARPDLGELGKILKSAEQTKFSKPDLRIINTTPEFYKDLINPNTINIGFTMFETDRIPKLWVDECNKLNAVFVPCRWNKEVFVNSGVKVPVYVVQPGFNLNDFETIKPDFFNNKKDKDTYYFYSVFQWTERKNPLGLLKAYFTEFSNNENVFLVLKTYGANTSQEQQNFLKEMIRRLKGMLRVNNFPKILFIGNTLSRNEMISLHQSCDCFVLPHRSEGVGYPHMEAMSCGKPAISTNYSGNTDFMNKDNSYLVDYQLTPVFGMMTCPWYESTMNWAEPDLNQLKQYMRYVYNNQDKAKEMGLKGYQTIKNEFNWEKKIQEMTNIMNKITRKK